ncbi:Hypothetical protein Minf_0705 [Methylacidiphilum infernorum V4]|uniref:Uncharacterized protein n=1 Tax=Methylacidiphilum infernorum (isolate V4) TaxID=481448 RepID=B3E0K6_METI4|nr:Hypothetical protein Minf_0705 [Methylacidiphilum infernorum V4]
MAHKPLKAYPFCLQAFEKQEQRKRRPARKVKIIMGRESKP